MKNLILAGTYLLFTACSNNAHSQNTVAETGGIAKEPGQPARTTIIYSSKHGATEKVANMIAERIAEGNDVTLISLADVAMPDISSYDKVILGTSIYMGKPRDEMKKFTGKKEATFTGKVVGLFVCGGEVNPDKRKRELGKAYPDSLHDIAIAEGFMGGEYNFERMSSFERKAMKMRAKVNETTSFIDYGAIEVFADKMK